jgi:PAS domain S-box-containing protein
MASGSPEYNLLKRLYEMSPRYKLVAIVSSFLVYALALLLADNYVIPQNALLFIPVAVSAFLLGVKRGFITSGIALVMHLVILLFVLRIPVTSRLIYIVIVGAVIVLIVSVLAGFIGELEGFIRRREAAAIESERKYRDIIDTANTVVIEIDGETRLTYINSYGLKLFGYTSEELLGRSILDTFVPREGSEKQDYIEMIDALYTAPNEYINNENENICKDGRRIWMSWSNKPRFEKDGRITGFLALGNDITEFKTMQKTLVESETRYREIVDNANSVILEIDIDGTILFINTYGEELFGYSADEVIGKVYRDSPLTPVDEIEETIDAAFVQDFLNNPDKYVFRENRNRCKDGRIIWMAWSNRALLDAEGNRRSILSIGTDISVLKKTETELIQASRNADAANRAKSLFLSNMSHEIRTPLSGIMGLTDLLLLEKPREMQKKYLSLVKDSAETLLKILNDVLDLSKIEAGKMDFKGENFSLSRLIDKTLEPYIIQTVKSDISIEHSIGTEVPEKIIGDPYRLRQVLDNLLSNAVKYTEKGIITVSIDLKQQMKGISRVCLLFTVSDTGIGIGRDHFERLFDDFSQVDSSYSKRYEGTGLGLAICKKLVELMDGEIWLESEKGKGTTFFFTACFDTERRRKERPRAVVHAADLPPVKPVRILVAEDDRVNSLVITRLLEKQGHAVLLVPNGMEILPALERDSFDLIIMDIQMPEIDGLEAAELIRGHSNPAINMLPIVACTAYTQEKDIEAIYKAGMNGYIAKPITPVDLKLNLNKLMGNREDTNDGSNV